MLALTPEATALLFAGMAALITAVTGAIALLVNIMRRQKDQTKQIHEVHVLVNSQLTDVTNRVAQLEAALIAAGIVVPDDPAAT